MAAPSDVVTPITTDYYVKGAMENAIAYSMIMKRLAEAGNLETIEGGLNYTFAIDGGLTGVSTVSDGADISELLTIDQLDVQGTLPWCDKISKAIMTNGMRRVNKGSSVLADYKKRIVPRAVLSLLSQGSGSAAYDLLNNDGTGSGKPLYGLPAVFKFDTGATGKEATVTSGSTYAGQSLESGGLASSISTPVDDYIWTPRGVNYNSTAWTSGTGGWNTTNALEVLDYTQGNITFDPSNPDMRPDTGISDYASFQVLRNAIEAKQSIWIQNPGSNEKGAGEWAIGTSSDKLFFGGIMYGWDGACPSGTIYMLNFNQIKLISQKGEDIDTTGGAMGPMTGESMGVALEFLTDQIISNRSTGTIITHAGQFQINPRYQAKIADFS